MAKLLIQYDALWADALRGIIRQVLRDCEKNGLPGGHHFYITFRTLQPDVEISPVLLARFPEEMTIVLQHQYWDLVITDDWFEVTLSFSNVNERLHIPFAAISAFADPFAKFGVQIPTDPALERMVAARVDKERAEKASRPQPLPVEKPKPASAAPAVADESGRVVTLDAFRKK